VLSLVLEPAAFVTPEMLNPSIDENRFKTTMRVFNQPACESKLKHFITEPCCIYRPWCGVASAIPSAAKEKEFMRTGGLCFFLLQHLE
jgi:hypothetical protein